MQNFQKASSRCICLSQTLQILWMLCGTNLCIQNFMTHQKLVMQGEQIINDRCKRMFPWSSLWPKTKHCREIARIIIYFPSIKARSCAIIKLSFGYFLLLTISSGDKKERWTCDTYEHGNYTGYNTFVCLTEGTTTKVNLNSTHLSFVAQQSKFQVWRRHVSAQVSFSHDNLNYLGLEMVLVLSSCTIK